MARTVTLSQLRTDVAAQCDFAVGASGRYTPTLLTRYINQSVQRFRERVSNSGMTHYLTSSSGTVSSGATSPYSFKVLDASGFSPAVVRVYGVDLTVSGVIYTLEHRPFEERNKYGSPTSTGIPHSWAMYQTTSIALMPAPSQSYSYTVWYLPLLADMSADGDTFDGVAGWEQWIVYDCVCQLVARDTYQSAYNQAVQLRNEVWQDVLRGATKVTSAGGAIIGRDTLRAGNFGRRAFSGPIVSGGSGLPPDGSVTNAMLASAPESTTLGRPGGAGPGSPTYMVPAAAAANVAVFSGYAAGLVPTGSGNPLLYLTQAGSWDTPSVGGAVTGLALSQIESISPDRVLGRVGPATGATQQLSGQQVASMIGVFTGSAHGLVPYPSGGLDSTLFLAGDATWRTPAGGAGGGPTMLAAAPEASVQYNGGSGFAGSSGLLFSQDVFQLAGNMRMPTGTILLGATGTELAPVGWLGASDGAVNIGLGTGSANPAVAIDEIPGAVRFRAWDVDGSGTAREWGRVTRNVGSGLNNLTLGFEALTTATRGKTVQLIANGASGSVRGYLGANLQEAFAANPGHHRWGVSGTTRMTLDEGGLNTWGGLGVQPLAHAGSSDKLAAWTASGFANVATGIQIAASGTSLEFLPQGPVVTASGIDMRSNAIANYAPTGITLAQFGAIPETTILGRTSPSGIPEALVPSIVATMLPVFNNVDKGLVPPASAGDATKFLAGDQTWRTPPGGGGGANNPGGPTGSFQWNQGSGVFAGASGFQFTATGIHNEYGLNMPTGPIRFGASGIANDSSLSLIRGPHGQVYVSSRNSGDSDNSPLLRYGIGGLDRLILGGGSEGVAGVNVETTTEYINHRIGNVTKTSTTSSHQLHADGIGLAIPQLSHSASTDKLASWTASGFANVATGINVGASGYQLSVGSGGPRLTGSGIDLRSGVIENAKRIGGLDGIKVYGFITGGGAASGSENIVSASGSAFVISPDATAGQNFALVPTLATLGDALIIDNRSSATHAIINAVGTGVGISSGTIVNIAPSMGVKVHFASGAWEYRDRYQLGGY